MPAGASLWSEAMWLALALMLIGEGLLPMLNPAAWRRVFERALALSDGQIRFLGMASAMAGALLLWLVAP